VLYASESEAQDDDDLIGNECAMKKIRLKEQNESADQQLKDTEFQAFGALKLTACLEQTNLTLNWVSWVS